MSTQQKTALVLLGALLTLPACSGAWVGSIHARLAWSNTGLRIVDVPDRGAAREAGLGADDQIIAIDGHPVANMPMERAVRRLRGPVGSEVELEIRHPDGTTETVTLERTPFRRE